MARRASRPRTWSLSNRQGLQLDPVLRREAVGLALLALSGVLLASLAGVARGSLAEQTTFLVRQAVGWGAYLVAITVGAAGGVLLVRGLPAPLDIPWGRVLGGEIAFVVSLGLAHLATRPADSLGLASQGGGGGFVGWAVSQALVDALGLPLATLLLLTSGLVGVGLILGQTTLDLLWALAESATAVEPVTPTLYPSEQTGEGRAAARRRPATQAGTSPLPRKRGPVRQGTNARGRRGSSQVVLSPEEDLPPLDLLDAPNPQTIREADARERADLIERTLASFGVPARVVSINQGPTITQFGVEPGFIERRGPDGKLRPRKVRVSRIQSLSNDLALALSAAPIRIQAPVPGRSVVGIEVPNRKISLVSLRGIMESKTFRELDVPLRLALGQDVSGNPVIGDLGVMPHLLIAGATGSGKSVCINAIIACLLFTHPPERLKLLLVDPKRVELVNFNGIPHLLAPAVVEMDEVVSALYWATREMERRFELFARAGVRNIEAYNLIAEKRGEDQLFYLVVVMDELADLMLVAPDETERLVCRLAQLARATGIHLVIATQRPSVDVVTGLIKANFPARISFAVTSQVDSRVILDMPGAEKLLGRGDMLFQAPDSPSPIRAQGAYVSDRELTKLVRFWKRAWGARAPAGEAEAVPWQGLAHPGGETTEDRLIQEAIDVIKHHQTASASFLQRRLRIGYPRAARLLDELEKMGIVGPSEGGGRSREVLIGENWGKDDDQGD
jgi:S-DNA-T family DNA segregation ATPase FtsK/SpoIIIE